MATRSMPLRMGLALAIGSAITATGVAVLLRADAPSPTIVRVTVWIEDGGAPRAVMAVDGATYRPSPAAGSALGASTAAPTVATGSLLVVDGSATSVDTHLCATARDCAPEHDVRGDGSVRVLRGAGPRTVVVSAAWDVPGIDPHPTFTFPVELVAGDAPAGEPPAEGVVACGTGTTVQTPVVRLQHDGVHLRFFGDGDPNGFYVRSRRSGSVGVEWAPGSAYPLTDVVRVPPGPALIRCKGTDPTTPLRPIVFVDVDASYLDPPTMTCVPEDPDEPGLFVFPATANLPASGIARSVPGVRPSDLVLPSNGYATGRWGGTAWSVVRAGAEIAQVETSTYGDRTHVAVQACPGSGVGEGSTVRRVATPFRLPGAEWCDPYGRACTPVFLSAAAYADLVRAPVERYTYAEQPGMACAPRQPEGCPLDPDDAELTVLAEPANASAFVATYGCGETPETMCRRSDVGP